MTPDLALPVFTLGLAVLLGARAWLEHTARRS